MKYTHINDDDEGMGYQSNDNQFDSFKFWDKSQYIDMNPFHQNEVSIPEEYYLMTVFTADDLWLIDGVSPECHLLVAHQSLDIWIKAMQRECGITYFIEAPMKWLLE